MNNSINRNYAKATRQVGSVLERFGPAALRASVAMVFVWFGALKLAGHSPVAELVASTLPWTDPAMIVPTLGAIEVALGLALVTRWPHHLWVPVAMIGYLAGTFMVLVVQPSIAFQHGNPLLLTTIGEFVVKNTVLIAALAAITSRDHPRDGLRNITTGGSTPNVITPKHQSRETLHGTEQGV